MAVGILPVLSQDPNDIQAGTVRRMDWPTADATEMMARGIRLCQLPAPGPFAIWRVKGVPQIDARSHKAHNETKVQPHFNPSLTRVYHFHRHDHQDLTSLDPSGHSYIAVDRNARTRSGI